MARKEISEDEMLLVEDTLYVGLEEEVEPVDKTEFAKEIVSIASNFLQIYLTLTLISQQSGG